MSPPTYDSKITQKQTNLHQIQKDRRRSLSINLFKHDKIRRRSLPPSRLNELKTISTQKPSSLAVDNFQELINIFGV